MTGTGSSDGESGFGKLIVEGNLKVTGDTTVSGELRAESVETATLSATTIYADEIIARRATFGDLMAATVSAEALVRTEVATVAAKLAELDAQVNQLTSESANQ